MARAQPDEKLWLDDLFTSDGEQIRSLLVKLGFNEDFSVRHFENTLYPDNQETWELYSNKHPIYCRRVKVILIRRPNNKVTCALISVLQGLVGSDVIRGNYESYIAHQDYRGPFTHEGLTALLHTIGNWMHAGRWGKPI